MANATYATKTIKGVREYVHRMVWEAANGSIPEGYDIHHIDGDGRNNVLSNLVAVSRQQHKMIHATNYRCDADGVWHKRCPTCKKWSLATTEFFFANRARNGLQHECRSCFKERRRK